NDVSMIDKLIPKSIKRYKDFTMADDIVHGGYFLHLDCMQEIQKNLNLGKDIFQSEDYVQILDEILEVFNKYASNNEIRQLLNKYSYALNQQFKYVQIFSQMLDVE